MKRTLNHLTQSTHLLKNKKPSVLGSVVFACIVGTQFTACTGDNVGEVKVIEDKKAEKEDSVSLSAISSTQISGIGIDVYDLSDFKKITTVEFNSTKKSTSEASKDTTEKETDSKSEKESEKTTTNSDKKEEKTPLIDKGLKVVTSIKKEDVSKNMIILSVLGSNESTTNATYYDPILQKTIAIPKGQPLMALSGQKSNKFDNVNPTPISTLAIYRSLARIGWFFDNDNLPTPKQFSEIIKNNKDFLYLYNTAMFEVANVLALSDITLYPVSTFKDITTIAEEDSKSKNPSTQLYNWVTFLAQTKLYQNKYKSTAPYFAFAHDMAKDFYDGDLDGFTYQGLGDTLGNLITKPFVKGEVNTINSDDVLGIYKTQQTVLKRYESDIFPLVTETNKQIISEVSDAKKTDVTKILEKVSDRYSTSDASELPNENRGVNYQLSYADYQTPSARTQIYRGVGNQTVAFGLLNDESYAEGINIDERNNQNIGIPSLAGIYKGNDCSVIISDTGVVSFRTFTDKQQKTTESKVYKTIIDRELQDNIFRTSNNGYVLNTSSKINNSRRFIQLNIADSKVTSASTAITSVVGKSPLANPDASCTFK